MGRLTELFFIFLTFYRSSALKVAKPSYAFTNCSLQRHIDGVLVQSVSHALLPEQTNVTERDSVRVVTPAFTGHSICLAEDISQMLW